MEVRRRGRRGKRKPRDVTTLFRKERFLSDDVSFLDGLAEETEAPGLPVSPGFKLKFSQNAMNGLTLKTSPQDVAVSPFHRSSAGSGASNLVPGASPYASLSEQGERCFLGTRADSTVRRVMQPDILHVTDVGM
mmetsp:Transcript_53209/g.110749  ORF Transcript_53209/g.110749 Transcript_53209/m.110749 type:complete len:134 (+) Transcript_53209:170-571(+)